MITQISRCVAVMMSGASLLGLATSAQARQAGGAAVPSSSVPATAADGPAGTDRAADIVVTGSRVIQNGNASPTPVTVVSTDSLQNLRPSTLADDLNSIPVFNGSRGQTNFGQGTGGSGGGNAVASVLNLRNIGNNRNLVLMDGRRVPPTTGFNTVDADTIPQLLISRVDVVTGGASAVYGSDAVSGVVNFITDKTFTGLKGQAYSGVSKYGDAATYDLGLAAGTKFAGGRGHIEISYEFRDQQGILSRFDRPWYHSPGVVGSGTADVPNLLFANARLPNQPFGGRVTCGAACSLNGQVFATDGVLSPFVNGQAVSVNGTTFASPQIGGAGGYQDNSVKSPLRSHQFYARADFDVTDDIKVFAYGSANIKRNLAYVDYTQLNNVSLSSANPFLSTAYQSALAAAGPTFTFSRLINQDESRIGYISKSNEYILVGGLTGKTAGIDWDLTYNHGDSLLRTTIINDVNQQHLAASLDAVRNASGAIVCGINNDAIASNDDPSCVPLNPFGPTASSQQALKYILGETHYRLRTIQNDIVANAGFSPFSTWAGPVQFALTGEWRQLRVSATSDYTPNTLANCTGIPRNCSTSNPPLLFIQSFSDWPEVRQGVAEGGAEVELPLLKDARFFRDLSVNGAVRYTDYYDTAGAYWTWKAGASWAIDDSLRLRGTISRDIRAPTLNDLYAPLQVNVSNSQKDLLTNTNPVIPQLQYGNAALQAEIGRTKTIGLVWKPGFVPGFSASVDYYDIAVNNAIITVIGSTALYQNACYDSGGTSIFCAFQTRPGGLSRTAANAAASNAWTSFLAYPLNIGKITTNGIDVEVNYRTSLFDRGLDLRLLAAWQPHIKYYQTGAPVTDYAGIAYGASGASDAPKVRITAQLGYQLTPNLRFDVQERWRSQLSIYTASIVTAGDYVLDPFAQTALNVTYTLPFGGGRQKYDFFFNVQNLFDAQPESDITGVGAQPGHNGGYVIDDDVVGTYFTAGIRIRL